MAREEVQKKLTVIHHPQCHRRNSTLYHKFFFLYLRLVATHNLTASALEGNLQESCVVIRFGRNSLLRRMPRAAIFFSTSSRKNLRTSHCNTSAAVVLFTLCICLFVLTFLPTIVVEGFSPGNPPIPHSSPFPTRIQNRASTMKDKPTTNNELNQADAVQDPPFRLGYVTDVEGNIEYFHRFVAESKVLAWAGETNNPPRLDAKSFHLELVGPNSYFVYGGDAVDKGPGDIRMVRCLVDLKRRHPDRVFLLVGNRDLNKLRFSAELSDADLARDATSIPPPHWDPKAPTLTEFLTKENLPDNKVNRLHYMLRHTLGCPKTFDFRREELAILRDRDVTDISDNEVLESCLHEVRHPDGSLRQYLEAGNVAVCIGNTLFCHGAVDAATMKFVPSTETRFENPTTKPPAAATIDNVQQWAEALNLYLKQGMEDYLKRPHWNYDRTSRGGESLLALQNRPAMWGRSIISNCYGDGGCITTDTATAIRTDKGRLALEKHNPLAFENVSSDPMDLTVAEWLKKDGIQRIVVGHKPTGDCPAVLSAKYTGVEIVSADTSFSDTNSSDNRGKALAIVEITGESSLDNHLETRGFLQSGARYSSEFARLYHQKIDFSKVDDTLGTKLANGDWWVKVIAGDSYYLTRGSGRNVECRVASRQEVLALCQQ